MNPDPSRSTTLSRRAVLTSLASIAALPTATSAANMTGSSSFGQPSIPNAFRGESWKQNDLGEDDNNDVAWIGQSLQNTTMQSRVEKTSASAHRYGTCTRGTLRRSAARNTLTTTVTMTVEVSHS